jgi:hypothetical protein
MPNSGRNTAFGVAVETTYGTAVSAALWLRAESWDDNPSAPTIALQALHSGRGQAGRSAVNLITDISGTLTARAHYDGGALGTLLRWGTGGTYIDSGAGPYKHDIGISDTLPSLTLRPIYGDGVGGATATGSVIAGAKCDTFSVTFGGPEALVDVSATWTGATFTAGSAETPTFGTDNAILPFSVGTIAWNSGTWTPSSLTLSVTNGTEKVRQLGAKTLTAIYQVQPRQVRVTFEVLRESDAFQTAHLATTESDLVVTVTNGVDIFKITLYTARVVDVVPHSFGDNGLILETITVEGRDDGTDDTLLIELTNGDATGEAS